MLETCCPEEKSRTYARNAFYGDLSDSLLKTGKTWVDFSDLGLFPLNEFLDDLRGTRKKNLGNTNLYLMFTYPHTVPPSAS